MVIINNSSINVGAKQHYETGNPPLETTGLINHIGSCLNMLPPKQLGRFLRIAFMIQFDELQKIGPGFYEFVSELGLLLVRLDGEEDRQAIAKING